jgi:hypothetical protein
VSGVRSVFPDTSTRIPYAGKPCPVFSRSISVPVIVIFLTKLKYFLILLKFFLDFNNIQEYFNIIKNRKINCHGKMVSGNIRRRSRVYQAVCSGVRFFKGSRKAVPGVLPYPAYPAGPAHRKDPGPG